MAAKKQASKAIHTSGEEVFALSDVDGQMFMISPTALLAQIKSQSSSPRGDMEGIQACIQCAIFAAGKLMKK